MATPWIDDAPYDVEFPVWTRAWIQEMAPGPVSPLAWDLFWSGPVADGWRDLLVDRMGFAEEPSPRLVGVFGGHLYLNASALRVWSARMPALAPDHVDTAYLVSAEDLPPYQPVRWHRPTDDVAAKLAGWLTWVLAEQGQQEMEAGRVLSLEAVSSRPPLAQLSDGELVERALSLQPLCRVLASQHLNQALAASVGPGLIAAVCHELGRMGDAPTVLGGLGDIESVAPARVLWTLSRQVRSSIVLSGLFDEGLDDLYRRLRSSDAIEVVGFLAGFDALLSEVGFRGTDDWDLSARSWREEPRGALAAINRLRNHPDQADPAAALARSAAAREQLVADLVEALGSDLVTVDHLTAAVNATRVFVRGRDRAKSNVTRVLNEMRAAVGELADRAAHRGDVADPATLGMLYVDELAYYADGGLADIRSITDERRSRHAELALVPPAQVIRSAPSPRPVRPVEPLALPLTPGDRVTGRPASAGVGRGPCRLVASAADTVKIRPGEVVVARSTSPSWIPFLVGAAGLVIEHASGLSHAVVAAREIGLPVVVAADRMQDRLRDGVLLDIDGTAGVVTLVQPSDNVGHPDEGVEEAVPVTAAPDTGVPVPVELALVEPAPVPSATVTSSSAPVASTPAQAVAGGLIIDGADTDDP